MSKLGFHVASARRTGAGDLLRAGASLVVMVDQNMIDEVHASGAIAAFRTQSLDDNPAFFMDAPQSAMPAIATAWMNGLKPKWQMNPRADFYIVNNEQDIGLLSDGLKLNTFFSVCMDLADQWGLKIGICSFSSGCPSDDAGLTLEQRWSLMLPAIEQCEKRGHVVVLHAHCVRSDSIMNSGESESMRHQRTLRHLASQGLHPKVIIGELSNGVGGIQPDLAGYLANVTLWDEMVMNSIWRDQILGGALYGFNAGENISAAVPLLLDWISTHPTPSTPPPPPPQPIGCSPKALLMRLRKNANA